MSFKLSLKCQIYLFKVEICSLFLFYSIPLLSFSSSQFSCYFLPLSFMYFFIFCNLNESSKRARILFWFCFFTEESPGLRGLQRQCIYIYIFSKYLLSECCFCSKSFNSPLSDRLAAETVLCF